MEPISFPQQTKVLTKPESMATEECGVLPVWTDGVQVVSRWKASWKERLKFLIIGNIWLWVWSGNTQPPVCVEIRNPFDDELSVLRRLTFWK